MFKKWIFISFLFTSTAYAAPLVWTGQANAFAAADRPTEPDEVMLEITLGYGDPSNTIGEGLWHSQVGSYDLTNDTSMNAFLVPAADTMLDQMEIILTDKDGYQVNFHLSEMLVFMFDPQYQWPPWQITGVQLTVLDILPPSTYCAGGGIVVRWDFLGVPEPSGLILCGIPAILLYRGRRWCAC